MEPTKNRACPSCREKGGDKKGDHLFLLRSGHAWYCTRCGYLEETGSRPIENDKEGGDILTSDNIEEKLREITSLKSAEIKDRKIRKDVVDKYGVKIEFNTATGEPITQFYPVTKGGKITGYKARKLPKDFHSVGDSKGKIELFGQAFCPQTGKKIVITGGELDCLSVYQVLKDKYPSFEPAVVSLPKGENSSAIKDNLDFLQGFDEVIIYTDMDEPGRKAADDIAKLIGVRSRIMETSEKDASDMLVKGKQAELVNAYFNASKRKPEGIIKGDEITLESVRKPTQLGFDTQYPLLNKMLGGLRKGELTTLTAGSGVGKSTLARELGYFLRAEHDLTIGNLFLEETVEKTVQGYVALDNNVPLSRLRSNPGILSQNVWEKSYNKLIANKWFCYKHFGSMETEQLLDKMRYLAYGENCDFIILDHLSMVFSGQQNDNERIAIDHAMTELAAFCNESGVGIIVVVHLSRNKSKTSFNEGGQVSLTDLRGSAALEQLSWNVLSLERDQQSEDEKNLSQIRVLKCREMGFTGEADKCIYSFDTGRLTSLENKLTISF